METTPFFVLLFTHLSALILGFGAVMVTDFYGLLWIFDRERFPQVVRVSQVTERIIWAGWVTMVATGVPLLVLKGVIDNLMIIKLFFVVLIGINGIPLYFLQKRVRGYQEGDQVPKPIMFGLVLSLVVSQVGWWGAMLIGFLHRHVQSVIEWPQAPWLVIGLGLAALLVVAVGGVALMRSKEAG